MTSQELQKNKKPEIPLVVDVCKTILETVRTIAGGEETFANITPSWKIAALVMAYRMVSDDEMRPCNMNLQRFHLNKDTEQKLRVVLDIFEQNIKQDELMAHVKKRRIL